MSIVDKLIWLIGRSITNIDCPISVNESKCGGLVFAYRRLDGSPSRTTLWNMASRSSGDVRCSATVAVLEGSPLLTKITTRSRRLPPCRSAARTHRQTVRRRITARLAGFFTRNRKLGIAVTLTR